MKSSRRIATLTVGELREHVKHLPAHCGVRIFSDCGKEFPFCIPPLHYNGEVILNVWIPSHKDRK